jgi:hypothetical protein
VAVPGTGVEELPSIVIIGNAPELGFSKLFQTTVASESDVSAAAGRVPQVVEISTVAVCESHSSLTVRLRVYCSRAFGDGVQARVGVPLPADA